MTTTVPAPTRVLPGLAVAVLPGVLAGLLGLLHPVLLTPGTAERWRLVHLLLLPVFPLVAAAVWWVLRGDRSPLADAARVLAAAYAVLYSALDSIAGIGAPQQVLGTGARGEPLPPVRDLYAIGDLLGHAGVPALALSGVLAAVVLAVRSWSLLAPLGAVVLVLGTYLHLRHHVFPPYGVLGLLLVAAGTGLLELSRRAAVRQP